MFLSNIGFLTALLSSRLVVALVAAQSQGSRNGTKPQSGPKVWHKAPDSQPPLSRGSAPAPAVVSWQQYGSKTGSLYGSNTGSPGSLYGSSSRHPALQVYNFLLVFSAQK